MQRRAGSRAGPWRTAAPSLPRRGSCLGGADDFSEVNVHPAVAQDHVPVVCFPILELHQLRRWGGAGGRAMRNRKPGRPGRRGWGTDGALAQGLTTGWPCDVFSSSRGSIWPRLPSRWHGWRTCCSVLDGPMRARNRLRCDPARVRPEEEKKNERDDASPSLLRSPAPQSSLLLGWRSSFYSIDRTYCLASRLAVVRAPAS